MIIWLVLVVSGVVAGTKSPRMMHVDRYQDATVKIIR